MLFAAELTPQNHFGDLLRQLSRRLYAQQVLLLTLLGALFSNCVHGLLELGQQFAADRHHFLGRHFRLSFLWLSALLWVVAAFAIIRSERGLFAIAL